LGGAAGSRGRTMTDVLERPAAARSEWLQLEPFNLEMLRLDAKRADRPTFVLVHGINNISPAAPFLGLLAEHGNVVAPSHPGFGKSPDMGDRDTIYDLAHLYRGVLDALPTEKVTLIGFSFGGWIATELGVAGHPKLDRLILVDPLGIKLAGREERDFPHLFNTDPAELNRRAWYDPASCPAGSYGVGWHAAIGDAMSDEEMMTLARNWDSLCLYAWRPHMYNPQLKHWLHRIAVPTLVLWGASDRIVTPDYGRAYSGLIPGAAFSVIEAAGHHPELEQPRVFVDSIVRFVGGGRVSS
jgi:pimeloyl-ACP methyl ester carboxylesterase